MDQLDKNFTSVPSFKQHRDKSKWERKSKETHWPFLFINRNAAVYFDFFGTEYFRQEVSSKIK